LDGYEEIIAIIMMLSYESGNDIYIMFFIEDNQAVTMKSRNRFSRQVFVFLSILGFVLLACNLPLGPAAQINSVQKTAEALSKLSPGTITALASQLPKEVIEAAQTGLPAEVLKTAEGLGIDSAAQTAAAILAGSNENSSPTVEPSIVPNVEHMSMPADPGVPKSEIADPESKETADKKYAPSGDEYNLNLFERPFDEKMIYRPDVDIVKASLSRDNVYYYVTIFLAGLDVDKTIPSANYGVEIDTNNDGRGDYLIWTESPLNTTWSTDRVHVYTDPNGDVGGKHPLSSDAPTTGNGYDGLIFTADKNSDPDLAWSRQAMDSTKAVQIAFKLDLTGAVKSFLWGVYADDGLKDPGAFTYNDRFTSQEAGSPLQKSDQYPLKALYLVDNTCRAGYNRAFNPADPGVCGGNQMKIPTIVIPTIHPEKIIPTLKKP
jgi:hypothetical protein